MANKRRRIGIAVNFPTQKQRFVNAWVCMRLSSSFGKASNCNVSGAPFNQSAVTPSAATAIDDAIAMPAG
jgi:hypothetical protein